MVQGFTRFRKIQVGKQSVIGTAVAATRVLPYRSAIVLNPNITDPDVDVGSLDPVISPYSGAQEWAASGVAGPQTYDDLAIRLSAAIKGGVTATGSAAAGYTWTYTAASLTADSFDYYSMQTGDDTSDSAGSGINGFGGVIDSFGMTMPEDLSPWTVSDDWIFAGGVYGNRTAALNVDSTGAGWMFGADTAFYLNSVPGAIGATQIVDAVRGASLTINNNLDQKRYANGSNTRFQLGAYGRGPRTIELTLTVEKTTAMIAEANTLDDSARPNRYIKIAANSTENAGTSTAYKAEFFLPVRLYNVSEGEIGGNSNYTLTYHGFYDATLLYAFKAVVVNKLSVLP